MDKLCTSCNQRPVMTVPDDNNGITGRNGGFSDVITFPHVMNIGLRGLVLAAQKREAPNRKLSDTDHMTFNRSSSVYQ